MRLWEAIQTDHYLERKAERGTIESVRVNDPQAYTGFNVQETNKKLVPFLQEELNKRFSLLENSDFGKSSEYNLGVVFFMPVLVNGETKAPIIMTNTEQETGILYVAFVVDNQIRTTYPTLKHKSFDIEHIITRHLRDKGIDNNKPPKATTLTGYLFEIDIEEVHGQKKEKELQVSEPEASEEDLDYTVRTDYRVGATFDHKKFGPGKIVSAAGGGKAGVNGVVDWVEVKYDKPFVKGGKLQDTRRFENILTKAYFGKTRKS